VWANLTITPLPGLTLVAIVSAIVVATVAAWWPARTAAKLDPCVCFQEV
jgi:putative ABC transport system permease protein